MESAHPPAEPLADPVVRPDLTDCVDRVRAFNRFYTSQLDLLSEGILQSGYSLTEARVLHELGRLSPVTAGAINQILRLDAGYLSRIVKSFEAKGLIRRRPSPQDARQSLLDLTAQGVALVDALNSAASVQIADMLQPLSGEQRAHLVGALATIQQLLAPPSAEVRDLSRSGAEI